LPNGKRIDPPLFAKASKWIWQSFTHQFWGFLGFGVSPNGNRIDPPLFAEPSKWVWQSFTHQFWGFIRV
jgi:hypothetical protein